MIREWMSRMEFQIYLASVGEASLLPDLVKS